VRHKWETQVEHQAIDATQASIAADRDPKR